MTEPTGSPPSPTPPPTGSWQPPSSGTSDFGVPVAAGPAPGVAYADLVQRIIAYIIDAILLSVIYFILAAILVPILFVSGGFTGALIALVVLGGLYLVGSALYFIYTWTSMRASPGQRVLGLETVNATDGATITRDQAIRRWAFLFGPSVLSTVFQFTLAGQLGLLSTVVSLLVFVYYIYLLYSASQHPKRQGFHDVQSNTVVIKRS
ncbi:MAG TPA: RDD family protein [Candidatus Limnocylindrales bacterium]|nr:RDD family protein [Candidatus Limnocylindrales bacterium]